jgi:hypothetical protein
VIRQRVEVICGLPERAIEIFVGTFVLDQQLAFPERINTAVLDLAVSAH